MIRIVTDTSSDITPTQAKALGVDLAPLDIHFDNTPYNAAADETFEEFYSLLARSRDLPTTSQPPPSSFLSIYQEAKEAGDDVIVITLTKKISGTLQSAMIAKEMAGYDRVHIIDSLSTVIGQRLLVERAVSLRKEGQSAKAIADAISDASKRLILGAGLDTLKYLRKGGRIPKSAEMIGTVLGVKPLIKLVDGGIIMAGKARGRAGVQRALLGIVQEHDDFDPQVPVYIGYTGSDKLAQEFRALFSSQYPQCKTVLYPVGAVVATHVGPGAFAIAYLTRPESQPLASSSQV